jgi:hypothetical protein
MIIGTPFAEGRYNGRKYAVQSTVVGDQANEITSLTRCELLDRFDGISTIVH